MADFSTLVLTVNSIVITHNQIRDNITINRVENESAIMSVTLSPPAGLQDVDYWAGQDVSLTIDGVTAFAGVVDMPEIDVIYKKITLVCNDKRREILNALDVSTTGYYSSAIFGDTENTIDELEQRLTTIPSAADIKPDGTSSITDINPKTIADFTLTDSTIYHRKPEASPTSRIRLTNQVNLTFNYRYTRLRHRERSFKIQDEDYCDIFAAAGPFTKKTSFIDYANQMDWLLNESTITWDELPESGLITECSGADFVLYNWGGYAESMYFDAAKRFAQTVVEEFTITVKAPQSITQHGVIEWNQDNGINIEYSSREWENFTKYDAPTGGTADVNDYYTDEDGLVADYENAILTAINIANTKIIKSHRDTQVLFETDLRLDFNLTHTIALSTDILDAQGKVTGIYHVISIGKRKGNTTTEISLSTAQGAQITDDITIAPARLTVPVVSDAWTNPQVMLITNGLVDTPAIDDTSRGEQIVQGTETYNIEIQDDTFGVTF